MAEIVCHVLSPLRNLVVTELPDPSLATLTVPELRFEAFKAVNEVPAPLNPVLVSNPVEGL